MQLTMGETSQRSDLLLAMLTHLFCLLVGLAALGTCAWVVATGQLFTLDGLSLIAVSGALATFFVGNTAWAVYTGEIRELLAQMRSKPGVAAPEPPPEKP
jgi:hypothetical protein